mmetsp:Transcript_17756/g.35810  ORF Transcript_17756/g.35810 Transcript_17756/m.35810 type:complete len:223 (+) Transcript_17756:1882-2550(+)
MVLATHHITADRHADSRANRRGRVPGAEGVMLGLGAKSEARKAFFLTEGIHAVSTPGEDLVGVALVPDVPDDAVLRRREYVVKSRGELDDTHAGSEVPSGLGHGVDDVLAELLRKLLQLLHVEVLQVLWGSNHVQDGSPWASKLRWSAGLPLLQARGQRRIVRLHLSRRPRRSLRSTLGGGVNAHETPRPWRRQSRVSLQTRELCGGGCSDRWRRFEGRACA